MNDPWAEIDEWCKQRAESLCERSWKMLERGTPLSDPVYRRLLGQSDAYHAMRSFIHGARSAQGTSPREG